MSVSTDAWLLVKDHTMVILFVCFYSSGDLERRESREPHRLILTAAGSRPPQHQRRVFYAQVLNDIETLKTEHYTSISHLIRYSCSTARYSRCLMSQSSNM